MHAVAALYQQKQLASPNAGLHGWSILTRGTVVPALTRGTLMVCSVAGTGTASSQGAAAPTAVLLQLQAVSRQRLQPLVVVAQVAAHSAGSHARYVSAVQPTPRDGRGR